MKREGRGLGIIPNNSLYPKGGGEKIWQKEKENVNLLSLPQFRRGKEKKRPRKRGKRKTNPKKSFRRKMLRIPIPTEEKGRPENRQEKKKKKSFKAWWIGEKRGEDSGVFW